MVSARSTRAASAIERLKRRTGHTGYSMARTASGEFGEFLRFETLTLCPIDTRCIDLSLLQPHEKEWLNGYHAEVRARLLPHVDGAARAWLELRTEAI